MAPLVLWHLYRHRQRPSHIAWAVAGAIAGVLLWLVPLLKLAGGWSEYRAASGRFFATELAQSSLLFSDNSAALFWNAGTWFIAWVQLLGPMLVLIIASIRSRHGCSSTVPGPDLLGRSAFWFLWIVPAALFYLLFHMGQIGYMLTFLVPVAGLMVMTLEREPVVSARFSGRLRRALWVTLVIEVAWFAGAPAVKRGYPTASGMDYFLHLDNCRPFLPKPTDSKRTTHAPGCSGRAASLAAISRPFGTSPPGNAPSSSFMTANWKIASWPSTARTTQSSRKHGPRVIGSARGVRARTAAFKREET